MAQLSVREAASELGVHPARVTQWIASGKIHAEWVDGPHGRMRLIDDDALSAMRRELRAPEANDPAVSDAEAAPTDGDAEPEPLARARAVESYTAGLAATAIAPAVSRLVETIERLIRENGDLRQEIGALKERLETSPNGVEAEPASSPVSAPSGLAEAEWDVLGERLDRLSQPMPTQPATDGTPTEATESTPQLHVRNVGRRRSRSPWTRMAAWLRVIRG
jgi:helix-turn-helix protein